MGAIRHVDAAVVELSAQGRDAKEAAVSRRSSRTADRECRSRIASDATHPLDAAQSTDSFLSRPPGPQTRRATGRAR
jgi:hypothetical protein